MKLGDNLRSDTFLKKDSVPAFRRSLTVNNLDCGLGELKKATMPNDSENDDIHPINSDKF